MGFLKQKIKEKAFEIGFSHIGFSRAEKLPDAPLLNWLSQGYHGTMQYMDRDPEIRLDPFKFFPGCKTVISLSLNYYTPYPTKAHQDQGRISRYAWGRDYHKVMRKKLKALSNYLLDLAGDAKVKICVDSSPVLEKAWAQKAGIGWQGKHSNLISKDLGSWIFLGEILTDLEIEPDKPHADFCGTCNKCIEACPTEAIVSPYIVDSAKCISYITIESKELPDGETAEETGDWIFGCDICQEVCPWNKFQKTTDESDFFPKLENQILLESWINMSEEEFVERFSGTPLMRGKHKKMIENAKNALNNLKRQKRVHAFNFRIFVYANTSG